MPGLTRRAPSSSATLFSTAALGWRGREALDRSDHKSALQEWLQQRGARRRSIPGVRNEFRPRTPRKTFEVEVWLATAKARPLRRQKQKKKAEAGRGENALAGLETGLTPS